MSVLFGHVWYHSACVIAPSKIVFTDTSLVKVPLQLLYGYYHHQYVNSPQKEIKIEWLE